MKKIICLLALLAAVLSLVCCQTPTEGTKTFTFEVYGEDGALSLSKEITTEALYVGEALLAEGLIEGDEGQFGLYVKKVNGIFAEYETTGTYWAFYIDGAYAPSGVDTTPITDGAVYAMKAEK